jgi:hypothetical protein
MGSCTNNKVVVILVATNIIYKFHLIEALQMATTRPRNHVINAATFATKTMFGNSLFYKLLE